MAGWLQKLTEVVLGNFHGSPKSIKKQPNGVGTVEFPKTENKTPYPGTAIERTGNKRVPNSVNQEQNLEDLKYKHFSELDNTENSLTNALNNYAKEVYGKPLDKLNKEEYTAVCNAARSYASKGGINSPARQLEEHYSIIANKFNK